MLPLLQPPDQVQRLVGGDAAADDQGDAGLRPRCGAPRRGRGRVRGGDAARATAPGFGRPWMSSPQDHPDFFLDRAAVAGRRAAADRSLMASSSFRMVRLAMGCLRRNYDSNASTSCLHCNHSCRTATRIPIKVAAMIQSASVRQRLLRPSARPMAAIVSGDSVRPSRVMVSSCSSTATDARRRSPAGRPAPGRDRRRQTSRPECARRAEIALDPFAHHGIGDLPDVELWIEAARHAFDHHHGLLQQDQFGPGLHVEQAGDLEQQGQQLRHRDFFGGAVVDRLADGADGLREILHRVMARHIAGLEMHFGDAAIVAGDEAQQDFGEEAPLLHARAGP